MIVDVHFLNLWGHFLWGQRSVYDSSSRATSVAPSLLHHMTMWKLERSWQEWTSAIVKTRPDTRPPVADGWAGAEMRVFPLFNSSVTDQPTDRPTNRRTDKASYRVACPQLKKNTNIRLDNFSLKPETKVLGQIAIFRASEPIWGLKGIFEVWRASFRASGFEGRLMPQRAYLKLKGLD